MDQSDISNNAELDFDRSGRCGFPEFIYGAGKTAEQIAGIMRKLEQSEVPVLATRVYGESATAVCREIPEAEYDELARTLCIRRFIRPHRGHIAVICAGTSDLPVAREALVTLEICGCSCELIPDCGVAGITRLLSKVERLHKADVVIAVAGMEGALPSVTAGLVPSPVIAVPTSVGYGASFQGLTALLAMLNSCASGVTVVNIDNGFGAACAAVRILNRMQNS